MSKFLAFIVKKIVKFKQYRFNRKLKNRIKEAYEYRQLTGRRCIVIRWKNEPVVFTKKQLKKMIEKKIFQPGMTIQNIEKTALYVTPC